MSMELAHNYGIGKNGDNSSELPHNFHNGAIPTSSCDYDLSLMDMMDNSLELSHISMYLKFVGNFTCRNAFKRVS